MFALLPGQVMAAQAPQPAMQAVHSQDLFNMLLNEAEKGSPQAMLSLGNLYEQGVGAPRNLIKALEWYQKAADADLAEGYYNVGVAYEIGLGNSGNLPRAVQNFEKAVQKNLPQAMEKMADLYFGGIGVKQDNAKGIQYLTRAANAGSSQAANTLGVIYLNGLAGQKKDAGKSLSWLTKSADSGNLEAMKNLAVVYKDGLGRKADPTKALTWYIVAIQGGYSTPDLPGIIENLKSGMSEKNIKTAEKDAEAWIKKFLAAQQKKAKG